MARRTLAAALLVSAFLLASPLTATSLAGKGGKGGGKDKPPSITLTSPIEGQIVRDQPLIIAGTVGDDTAVSSVEVLVNSGDPAPLSLQSNGAFLASAVLTPGVNLIEVRATDSASQTVSETRSVTFMPLSAEVIITSPADGDVIHAGSIDIVGELRPPATRLDIGGIHLPIGNAPFHLSNRPLREGTNTISVRAADDAGNRYETSIAVDCTSTGTPLILRTDTPGGTAPLEVSFTLENLSGETITGWEMDFDGDGAFAPVDWQSGGVVHTYDKGQLYRPVIRVATAEEHYFSASTDVSVHGPSVFLGSIQAEDPVDLAVDDEGRLYVLERAAARVRVFDGNDSEIASFGSRGTGLGEFTDPAGIGIDGIGMIYVTDRGSDQVVRFTPDGQPLDRWGYSGGKFGEMSRPEGISVAFDGNIALADSGNSRIDWYRGHGHFEKAGGAGILTEPAGVAWTVSGAAAVSDRAAGSVLLLSKWNELVHWQSAPGDFEVPAGVSYSENGQVLAVTDEGSGSVTLLRVDGRSITFLRKIDEMEGDATGLLRPRASIRRDHPTDEIYYIADTGHNRVVKVRLDSGPDRDPEVVWASVRDSLTAGDVEGALDHFSLWTRENYRQVFADAAARMDEIVADMGEIYPLEREPLRAVYGLIRQEGDKPYLFQVVFARDKFGQEWKILYW